MDVTSDFSTSTTNTDTCIIQEIPRGIKRKNLDGLTDDESDNDDDEYKPLPRNNAQARSTPPIKFIDEKYSKRPLLYSENTWVLFDDLKNNKNFVVSLAKMWLVFIADV